MALYPAAPGDGLCPGDEPPATAILTQYGVPYTCDEVAESILNRTGTASAPWRRPPPTPLTPTALAAIRQKVQELRAMSGR